MYGIENSKHSSQILVNINGLWKWIDFPNEWLDVLKVDGGNCKHKPGSWSEPQGATMSHKNTHSSMFRHLASSYANHRIDSGTELDHLLSVAFRALALYTRIQRGIKHSEDI